MPNQFSVSYNGHPVAVTVLEDNSYVVQVSYQPLHIQQIRNSENEGIWIQVDTQQETYVTKEIGKLIEHNLASITA